MNFNQIPIIAMLTEKMTWLSQRQKVLAQNIAHADSPNYHPRDLKPLDFSHYLRAAKSGSVSMMAPNSGHLNARGGLKGAGGRGEAREIITKGPETTPTGNSVVLEAELMKVNETQLTYSLLTNLYRKQVSMMRTALGRRN